MKTKHILYILISFTINICGKASCEVVYRQVIEEYDVSSIYTAGNLLSTCVMDSTGAKLTEVSNEYYSYGLTNTAASGVNGGKYYYHSDHLGSSVLVTDSCGLISQQVEYLPYGEVFLERQHNSDPSQPLYATPYRFNGKELDEETGLYYYGARYMNPRLSIWYATDPMQEKYPNISSYAYCAGNPICLFDFNGLEWKDIEGHKIENHNSIKVYIFYDPKSFDSQSMAMYFDAIETYGSGSVALSSVTTMKEFSQDWENMKSKKIQEVNLNYHGSNQALHLDYAKRQYITATGNGKTNTLGNSALNVQDLPNPLGDISHAQLNINSCESNSRTQHPLKGNGKTLMETFADEFKFQAVRGSSVGVSYGRLDKMPHPEYFSSKGWFKSWEYIGTPIKIPAQKTYYYDYMYFKTGGMK